MIKFPEKLKTLRKEAGLTQRELEHLAEVGTTLVSHYEIATRRPSLLSIRKLARALDVTVDYFLDEED